MTNLPRYILFDYGRKQCQANGWGYHQGMNGYQGINHAGFIPHRTDGPAIERFFSDYGRLDGYTVKHEYWLNGVHVPKTEFEEQYLITHLCEYKAPKPFKLVHGLVEDKYDRMMGGLFGMKYSVFGWVPTSAYKLK